MKKALQWLDELESKHFKEGVSKDTVERHWAIPKIIPPNPKSRILDVGAGSGYISSKLKAQGHDVVAIEIAQACIEQLKMRNIQVIPHNLMNSPYPIKDGSFDIVVCADVLEHLFRPDICVKEAYRLLRQGGALIVSTPNYSHPYRIWQLIKGEGFHDPLDYQFYAHIKLFTYKTLKRFLEHFGFFVADVFLPIPAIPSMYRTFTKGSIVKRFFAMHVYPKIFYRLSPRFCDEPILLCRKEKSETKTRLLHRDR